MSVVVDVGAERVIMDARVFTVALDCGCWPHAAREQAIEIAISPHGRLLGVRARSDSPFSAIAISGPIMVRIDSNVRIPDGTEVDNKKAKDNDKAKRKR